MQSTQHAGDTDMAARATLWPTASGFGTHVSSRSRGRTQSQVGSLRLTGGLFIGKAHRRCIIVSPGQPRQPPGFENLLEHCVRLPAVAGRLGFSGGGGQKGHHLGSVIIGVRAAEVLLLDERAAQIEAPELAGEDVEPQQASRAGDFGHPKRRPGRVVHVQIRERPAFMPQNRIGAVLGLNREAVPIRRDEARSTMR